MKNEPIQNVTVFCGSATGTNPAYVNDCLQLAKILCDRGITLIYGGGNIGLMGVLADEMLKRKGNVIGVIPQKLVDIEVAHNNLTKLHIVKNMHQRKALMADLADAFLVLPGGIGTMDEFFEIFTWQQLGYHHKPIGISNVEGYYNNLLLMLDHFAESGFVRKGQLEKLIIGKNIVDLTGKILT
ncbi:MAG: TIGR00730 family Rossman fold protein [Bacteroidales bacterium]|nr:TIGR00730 family Rossman fold protein [Bacteroidales bacterium]